MKKASPIRSMTGFGRAEVRHHGWTLGCQIRSVNHRFLDLQVQLPEGMGEMEDSIRRSVKRAAMRGRIEVRVRAARKNGVAPVKIDRGLASALATAVRQLGSLPGVRGELDAGSLLEFPGLVRIDSSPGSTGPAVRKALQRCVDQSLRRLDSARRTEGKHLARDLRRRIDSIERSRRGVEKLSSRLPGEVARRVRKRVEDLMDSAPLDPGRLEQEVAILASRCDISEELVKLQGVLSQSRALVGSNRGPIGKRLDFLIQEMNREANTIGSKSGALAITRLAVEMKTEIEKLREQVQNLE